MHIFRVIIRGGIFQEPPISQEPPTPIVALSSGGQNEHDELPDAVCGLCVYWSGLAGNNPATEVICAVSIPEPTKEELAKASGRLAYAFHKCKHFKRKPVPAADDTAV